MEIIDLVKIIFMSHPSISSWGEASEGYTVSGLNKKITFFGNCTITQVAS